MITTAVTRLRYRKVEQGSRETLRQRAERKRTKVSCVSTHRDRFVMGSRITMQSDISPNFPKYSRSPSANKMNTTTVSDWRPCLTPTLGGARIARRRAKVKWDDSGFNDADNGNSALTWCRLPAETTDEHFPANRKRTTGETAPF